MNCPVICQSMQSQMADFSAGQMSLVEANAFEKHCDECAICRHEWETFQGTLLLLSGLCQPLPCEDASHEMWDACAADWMMRVEMRRSKVPLWGAIRGWAIQQPRWGWVALSGAVMVFGSVWMLSPANTPSDAANYVELASDTSYDGGPIRVFGSPSTSVMQSGMRILPSSPNARRVEFMVPPEPVSFAVDYHARMAFDPFVDHVGSGLVASAQPLINQPVMNQSVAPPPVRQIPVSPLAGESPGVQPLAAQPTLKPSAVISNIPDSASPVPMATPTLEASINVPR